MVVNLDLILGYIRVCYARGLGYLIYISKAQSGFGVRDILWRPRVESGRPVWKFL